MKTKRIPLEYARNSLAVVWFSGGGLAFLIVVVQSILGHYGDDLQAVWNWFLPYSVPTLALMIGVFGANALRDENDPRNVKAFFFRLSRWLSIFYLAILLLTILLEPVSSNKGMDLFKQSVYFLAPLQSLVVAAITVLFTSQESAASPPIGGNGPAETNGAGAPPGAGGANNGS